MEDSSLVNRKRKAERSFRSVLTALRAKVSVPPGCFGTQEVTSYTFPRTAIQQSSATLWLSSTFHEITLEEFLFLEGFATSVAMLARYKILFQERTLEPLNSVEVETRSLWTKGSQKKQKDRGGVRNRNGKFTEIVLDILCGVGQIVL
jgi:hypothetical protein